MKCGPRLRWARVLVVTAVVLPSCQSYEPSPLNASGHRGAWHARSLGDSSLAAFLESIELDRNQPGASFDPSDGISLREGQLFALVFHPKLRLERLRLGRAHASAEHAALWVDPRFSLEVLRIAESVPDRWVITPGLAITIPLSGGPDAEQRLADARTRAAQQRVVEAEWLVWRDVRQAWIEWSAAGMRVEQTKLLVRALDSLVEPARLLADSGELARTEASLFAVEQAQRRNELLRLEGEVDAAQQRLRAQLGIHPEAELPLLPTLLLPDSDPGAQFARGGTPETIAKHNPSLARLQEEYQVAEECLRREVRRQYPDLTLGPLYESDAGQSRVGFLSGIPIPILNRNRRAIAQARVNRELARAAYESKYETLTGRWAAASAREQGLIRQRADMEQTLVPLLDRQLEDATRLMQLGEGSGLVLLESLTRAYDTKLELIDTRRLEGRVQAELEFLIGPLSRELSAEARQEAP